MTDSIYRPFIFKKVSVDLQVCSLADTSIIFLEKLMAESIHAGIDISKEYFDIALQQYQQIIASGQFTNDPAGFKALRKWLKKQKVSSAWFCMEATGRYGDPLAQFLFEQGHQVSLINPARIKRYIESKLRRNKFDRLDAKFIADFCATQNPPLWSPPPPEARELQEMVRRLNALIKDRTREKNRLKSGIISDCVLASIHKHIDFINLSIDQLKQDIDCHIEQYPSLKDDSDLLESINGIGPPTAAIILGELGDLSRFDHTDQVVAYAGLSVKHFESGSSVRAEPKLSKLGNSRLRAALYFPAISAIRYNPIIQALALRLENRGKTPMQIIGAAMRKLLRLAFGVLKTRQAFDPNFIHNMQVTA